MIATDTTIILIGLQIILDSLFHSLWQSSVLIGSHWQSQIVISSHWWSSVVIGTRLRSMLDLLDQIFNREVVFTAICGLDGWMDGMGLVIIGCGQSKSTLGADKNVNSNRKKKRKYKFKMRLMRLQSGGQVNMWKVDILSRARYRQNVPLPWKFAEI